MDSAVPRNDAKRADDEREGYSVILGGSWASRDVIGTNAPTHPSGNPFGRRRLVSTRVRLGPSGTDQHRQQSHQLHIAQRFDLDLPGDPLPGGRVLPIHQQLFSGFGNSNTLPPEVGTYTYALAPGDPTSGVITVTGGPGIYFSGTKLTFASANAGYSARLHADSGGETFYFTPSASTAGAGNVSTRGLVSAAVPMEAGFVIEGVTRRWVLVRGVGPSLVPFGVTDAVNNPQVTVYSGSNVQATLSAWSGDPNLVPGFNAIFALAGAFSLTSGSADCAGIYELGPGTYTAQASAGGQGGEMLIEVYILPFGL
ncbi:MAG TPA: hypothetical protein VGF85_08300 [Opitutaceae bacterium]|jgi:hypothetical protein